MASFGVPKGSLLLAAASGGADSTSLLMLLSPWCRANGIGLEVVHFNHRLRGSVEDSDEQFVRSLCERLGLACHVDSPKTPILEMPGSMEQASRAVRHAFFARIAASRGAFAVCTGHTRDDAAETLLLRLLRGGGATGLSGMRPSRRIAGGGGTVTTILRPLLACSHAELRDFLSARGQEWREDATNSDTSVPRNAVRFKVLPFLDSEFAIDSREAIARSAEILRADDELLDRLAHEEFGRVASSAAGVAVSLDAAKLASLPLALRRRVLRLALRGWGADAGFDSVARILQNLGNGPWSCDLPGGARISLSRCGALRLAEEEDVSAPEPAAIAIPGTTRWGAYAVATAFADGVIRDAGPVGRIPSSASLSREAVERGGGLQVRGWRHGDRIAPLGMDGSRKLQDIFTDARIPPGLRAALPVVCCGADVAWIPGYRVARAFALPDISGPAIHIRIGECKGDS